MSKSPSCHDENGTQGHTSRGRTFQISQRQGEKEAQNVERSSNGKNSENGSRLQSKTPKAGSQRPLREGSLRNNEMNQTYTMATPHSKYPMEASRQGNPSTSYLHLTHLRVLKRETYLKKRIVNSSRYRKKKIAVRTSEKPIKGLLRSNKSRSNFDESLIPDKLLGKKLTQFQVSEQGLPASSQLIAKLRLTVRPNRQNTQRSIDPSKSKIRSLPNDKSAPKGFMDFTIQQTKIVFQRGQQANSKFGFSLNNPSRAAVNPLYKPLAKNKWPNTQIPRLRVDTGYRGVSKPLARNTNYSERGVKYLNNPIGPRIPPHKLGTDSNRRDYLTSFSPVSDSARNGGSPGNEPLKSISTANTAAPGLRTEARLQDVPDLFYNDSSERDANLIKKSLGKDKSPSKMLPGLVSDSNRRDPLTPFLTDSDSTTIDGRSRNDPLDNDSSEGDANLMKRPLGEDELSKTMPPKLGINPNRRSSSTPFSPDNDSIITKGSPGYGPIESISTEDTAAPGLRTEPGLQFVSKPDSFYNYSSERDANLMKKPLGKDKSPNTMPPRPPPDSNRQSPLRPFSSDKGSARTGGSPRNGPIESISTEDTAAPGLRTEPGLQFVSKPDSFYNYSSERDANLMKKPLGEDKSSNTMPPIPPPDSNRRSSVTPFLPNNNSARIDGGPRNKFLDNDSSGRDTNLIKKPLGKHELSNTMPSRLGSDSDHPGTLKPFAPDSDSFRKRETATHTPSGTNALPNTQVPVLSTGTDRQKILKPNDKNIDLYNLSDPDKSSSIQPSGYSSKTDPKKFYNFASPYNNYNRNGRTSLRRSHVVDKPPNPQLSKSVSGKGGQGSLISGFPNDDYDEFRTNAVNKPSKIQLSDYNNGGQKKRLSNLASNINYDEVGATDVNKAFSAKSSSNLQSSEYETPTVRRNMAYPISPRNNYIPKPKGTGANEQNEADRPSNIYSDYTTKARHRGAPNIGSYNKNYVNTDAINAFSPLGLLLSSKEDVQNPFSKIKIDNKLPDAIDYQKAIFGPTDSQNNPNFENFDNNRVEKKFLDNMLPPLVNDNSNINNGSNTGAGFNYPKNVHKFQDFSDKANKRAKNYLLNAPNIREGLGFQKTPASQEIRAPMPLINKTAMDPQSMAPLRQFEPWPSRNIEKNSKLQNREGAFAVQLPFHGSRFESVSPLNANEPNSFPEKFLHPYRPTQILSLISQSPSRVPTRLSSAEKNQDRLSKYPTRFPDHTRSLAQGTGRVSKYSDQFFEGSSRKEILPRAPSGCSPCTCNTDQKVKRDDFPFENTINFLKYPPSNFAPAAHLPESNKKSSGCSSTPKNVVEHRSDVPEPEQIPVSCDSDYKAEGSPLKRLSQLDPDSKEINKTFNLDASGSLDFITICEQQCQDKSRVKLPKKPDLTKDEIQRLIKSETVDVESARCLISEEKKLFKKPCPKQHKAQISVKRIVHTHDTHHLDCAKEYGPLVDPDPEDISPDVAAAMMFSQEEGLRLEACPHETIKHLFPDGEHSCDKIPANKISMVDTNQKDEAELMERSAEVPSEGVSDSAYTLRVKQKCEEMGSQESYDFESELNQGKREYVLVTQKPERYNKIQFRGSDPTWFPGYFSAFPDERGIKVVPSPSGVFNKAWVVASPRNRPKSDIIVIE